MNRPLRTQRSTRPSWIRLARHAVLAVVYVIAFSAALSAATLRSPWDGKSVKVTDAPYPCPAVARVAPDLVTDGFYRLDDPTHSIVDPVRMEAYHKSADGVKATGLAVVNAADAYRTSGSREAAQCAMNRIVTMAKKNSLNGKMSSNQAYYVQGWVVGAVAIAYLKVRGAGYATPQKTEAITNWLHDVGEQTKGYYDAHRKRNHGDAENNHLYWAGLELAAIGVAANDRSDFDWAVAAFDDGVDQIRPDGTLPREMARGRKALHYHLYALAPLVLLAEFGEANNIDLYAHANGAIHRLVNASIAGLRNPAPFEKATGIKQEVPRVIGGGQIAWAPPYVRRFPNAELTRMFKSARDLSDYYLGGLPPN